MYGFHQTESFNNLEPKANAAKTTVQPAISTVAGGVLMAGGGASATRVNQRIGRTLRIDRSAENPRDKSFVVYYQHNVKYLDKHAKKALSIMKDEPKFNIVKSKGRDHILSEISEVMDLGFHQKNIFDI